jgi:ATP-dependent DNA helicase DinG
MKVGVILAKFAVVDIETTGHSPHTGDQIIEIGIVIVENKKIIKEYSTYIKPNKPIPPFITNLTGITDEDVKNAPEFSDIAMEIVELCKDAYFVAHHVQFDLGFINETFIHIGLEPINEKIIDTVELARILTPKATGFKLSQLAEYYQIFHKHPHRALSDAFVTAELLIKLLNKAENLPLITLESLLKLETKLQSDLYEIFSEIIEQKRYQIKNEANFENFQGVALKVQKEPLHNEFEIHESFGEFLDELFLDNGLLSKYIPNYEPRVSQRVMCEQIYAAFQEEHHALLEAETGTGKTLGYLIPSIYFSLKTGKKIVISTYTTQLQLQAYEKEIPLLKQVLNHAFKAVILKGKSHYLSLKRFIEELNSPASENYDVVLTKAIILVWLTETETGDIDELHLPSSGYIFWRRINAEREGIIDPKSPFFYKSFYQRIKKQAQGANIVITNHALLCTDIASDSSILPSYSYCVIDEAHHLDRLASKYFGTQLNYVSIQYFLSELKETLANQQLDERLQELREYGDELFRYIYHIVKSQKSNHTSYNDVGRIQFVFKAEQIDSNMLMQLRELANRYLFKLNDFSISLSKLLEQAETKGEMDKAEQYNRMMQQIEELRKRIKLFLIQDDADLIKWIEIEGLGAKNAVYLYCEPIEIGTLLKNEFFAKKKSVILTSATLSVSHSFEYIKSNVGLTDFPVESKKLPSPFPMKDQVRLMIPTDLPHIKNDREEEYITAISYAICELAKISKGRMLVLFTSYQMLKKTHEMLGQLFDQDDFVIISQGISSGSRERLKKNFQSFDKAILLGTSSFWEGIDIPGEDLSVVVIVRLPFEPPNHPVYSVRSEQLKEQGKNPFMKLALPSAVIRFKQGFGRLIRTSHDKGIVMVCDNRIINTKYGKYFLESIPEVPIYDSPLNNLLEKVKDWFS